MIFVLLFQGVGWFQRSLAGSAKPVMDITIDGPNEFTVVTSGGSSTTTTIVLGEERESKTPDGRNTLVSALMIQQNKSLLQDNFFFYYFRASTLWKMENGCNAKRGKVVRRRQSTRERSLTTKSSR